MKRYFDVNVFVYYFLNDPKFGEKAYEWIKTTDERITSVITPLQLIYVLSKILKKSTKEYELVNTIVSAFSDLNIQLVEIPWDEIPDIIKKYKLDIEDAIHVASAMKENAELVSNDDELKKKINAKF